MRIKPLHCERAFTALELFMGLAITTLVFGAMAAFCLAMTSAWKSAEKSQKITLKGQQIIARVQSEIRNARLLGACRAGSSDESAAGAAIMIWKSDKNNDGYIQGDEVELIVHDTSTHKLKLFYTGQADAVGTWSYSTNFTAASVINDFQTGRSSKDLAGGVYGAVFQTTGTSGTSLRPSLQFALKLMVDDSQSGGGTFSSIGGEPKLLVQYGSATVRAPIAAPGN
jgi:hypothetical protein